ncbi:Hef nuclease [Bacteroidales bacterium Barb6XT]|nr:Hef nuclease [Bacteroidales bacterium Barb6XT]
MYNDLQKICKTPTRKTLPNGTNALKKVILVSATPLNNKPEDIANQIYLFQDSKDSTLEIGNLQNFFRQQIDAYRKLKDEPDIPKVQEGVKRIYERIRVKVIEPLTVRRTRSDLIAHDLYSKDLEKQGIKFPKVKKPEKILYELDSHLDNLYDRTIFVLSNSQGLKYYRYQAIAFLKPHKKAKYKQADRISEQLAKIMKTLLVKRIDSSFYAFKQSLFRFTKATEAMIKMFDNGKIYIAPNLPVSDMINEGKEEELLDLILENSITDPTIDICEPNDFEYDFLPGLMNDFKLLKELLAEWEKVDKDPKLATFAKYLQNILLSKKINPQSKLVVFSESKETTEYLDKELPKYVKEKILSIDSKNRKDKMPIVRKNFDANLSKEQQENAYNIVLTTEVLAEGVNLHRSNVIVNYDTPWNSTRLMQRIGRVNRIGSTADEIHIFNFYPTAKVNNDIELEKKAIMKLQAFHAALGEDSQIYSPDEQFESFGLFDKQIEEGKDEKLGYLMLIRDIKENHPAFFKQIKNMPLRSRVGRRDKELNQSTICYIKDQKRDAFIFVNGNQQMEELTFLETVKIFEAELAENGIHLHSEHHKQVQSGIKYFAALVDEEKAKDKKIDNTQGPNEKKANAFLDAILNSAIANEDERILILKAKEALRQGKFQNLQRDINKFQRALKKSSLKPAVILENTIKILEAYPLINEVQEPLVTEKNVNVHPMNPEIIITESFSI